MMNKRFFIVVKLVGMAALAALAGCEAVSAAAYQAHGPEDIKAEYVPQKQPTLVLVENFSGGSVQETDTAALVVDLMRELTARYQLKGICLTGFGMDDDISRSAAAGFHEHLTKPVDLQRLEAVIESLAN